MSCGTITQGSGADCDEIPEVGTRARLILMNYNDVDSITIVDNRVTNVTLVAGKKAYEFLGFRNDIKKEEEVVEYEGQYNRFRHSVGFVVYEDNTAQKVNVEALAKGRFIAIAERSGKALDSLELIGKDVGLQIQTGVIRNAYESSGLFVLSLFTPDNGREHERRLPLSFGTTYEAGLALIDELLDLAGAGVFDVTFDPTFN